MKIVPKLLILISTLTVLAMTAVGYGAYSIAKKSIEGIVDQQIDGTLELVESIFEENNEKLVSIADIASKNRNLSKALDRGINRGVSQTLNDIAVAYENINYILVLDYDSSVFSASTTTSSGKKFSGELILTENLETNPLFSNLLRDKPFLSEPQIDPFRIDSSASDLSQWISSPIKRRDKLIGWVIISTHWSHSYKELMTSSLDKLVKASYPVLAIQVYPANEAYPPVEARLAGKEIPVIATSKSLPSSFGGIQLELDFDRAKTYETLYSMIGSIAYLIIGGSLALALTLFVALRQQLINPITKLVTGIKNLGHESLGKQLTVYNNDEFGKIANSVNELTNKLSQSTISAARLDQEVKEKEALMTTLQETSHKLTAILDTAADGMITIDINGIILSFNQAAQNIFGYQESEMIGQPVTLLMNNKDSAHHQSYMNNYLNTGHSKIINVRDKQGKLGRQLEGRRRNGEVFPIQLSIARVNTENGVIFSGLVKDITEAKQAERNLIQAKEEAEQGAIAKSEFLAVMSHEIRTPMNGVIGMLELLMDNHLNKSQSHQAYLAHDSAVSLLNLINDILDFSKIEADKLELEDQHFNPRKVLGDLAESLATQIQNDNLELVLDTIGVTETMILGDATRIRQIFANLLSNALKFTKDGEIIIKAKLEHHNDDQWKLIGQVIDSGIGIPKDKVSHLFDKFSQVDASTTRKYGGTGLGLAIVKKLCQLMGGDVYVESREGTGSTFTFEIFVGKSNESAQVLPTTDISQLSILVVDDNAVNREVLRAQLEIWGATVTESDGYYSALKCCSAHIAEHGRSFDIAFLDMQMPDADGIDLCKKMKSEKDYRVTELIMMTSMDSVANQDLFKKVGFSGYFPKPATTSDLFDALNVIGSKGFSTKDHLVTHNYLSTLEPREQERAPIEIDEGLKVLVVEDNRVNQIVIEGVLSKMGIDVSIAEHGKIALASLNEQHFDLVLMDCQMPEMDGYEATQQIRLGAAGDNNIKIPIIAMTANAMSGDRDACLKAGMNDYLAKPINKQEVLSKISEWSKADALIES
ncbi:response regulator [Vibrio sp. T187]|uniref:response regulator n=1 Tax=Vibrio TaxID=662 RepID=UPI0010C9F9D5|nr:MULTISPECIES: response regulator [Vibrio]MBW3694511.1 response regulator [Vibrio sp. T187]